MEVKISKDDFIRVYDLRLHMFLKKQKKIDEILVAKDNRNKVFSLYFVNDELEDAMADFDVIEQDRLSRIRKYEIRNKKSIRK